MIYLYVQDSRRDWVVDVCNLKTIHILQDRLGLILNIFNVYDSLFIVMEIITQYRGTV